MNIWHHIYIQNAQFQKSKNHTQNEFISKETKFDINTPNTFSITFHNENHPLSTKNITQTVSAQITSRDRVEDVLVFRDSPIFTISQSTNF